MRDSPNDLWLLHEVSRALLFGLSPAEIPEYLCGLVVERLGVDTACVNTVGEQPAATPLVTKGAGPGFPPAPLGNAAGAPAAVAVANAKPVVIQNLQADPRGAAWRAWAAENGYRAVACVPLIGQDRILAVFTVFATDPAALEEGQSALLQSLANLAAIALAEAEAKEQIRQRQAELAHVQRVMLLSQLASGLAHEINQPLSAIANFAGAAIQLHRDGMLTPDAAGQLLAEVHGQAQRAGDIVRRMRAFLQNRGPEFTRCDLNAVVAESLTMMGPELARGQVRAALAAAANLPPVRIDPVQVQQVLVNLIQNAIDAMADLPPARRSIEVATIGSVDRAIVRVTDAGHGIAPADLTRVFDSFFSTKPAGLGMGLNISRSIIESHGGSLTAANNESRASAAFEFVLPTGGLPSQ